MYEIIAAPPLKINGEQVGLPAVVGAMLDGSELANSHEGLVLVQRIVEACAPQPDMTVRLPDEWCELLNRVRQSPTLALPVIVINGQQLSRRHFIPQLNAIRDAKKIEPEAPATEAPADPTD